mmetsp:Transcript_7891/g.14176  ORF Transcript_7891/g.14176 Transcript_7891/m.14176 type:complete len:149 (-) Transcript_7891:306-752(-)
MNHNLKTNGSLMSCSSTESDSDDSSSSKKVVRFAPKANLQYQSNASEDPRSSSWYSASDYKRFRVDRATDASNENECFWGLENVIVPNLRERVVHTRDNIRKGVLAEQKSQFMQCRYNPDDISRASSAHSEWSAAVARKKASFYSSCL